MGRIKKAYETGTIYGLFDPYSGELRYIGQTVVPLKVRLCGHVSSAKVPVLPKDFWVLALLLEGKRPVIREIETVPLSEMDAAEKRWIRHYNEQGANLLNRQELTTEFYRETEEYRMLKAAERWAAPVFDTLKEDIEYRKAKDRRFYQLVRKSWESVQN